MAGAADFVQKAGHTLPYLPPYISIRNQWMEPNEIIASDTPWAVAWSADRRSLWLPDMVERFNEFHDFGTLGGPLNGIYLTPVSGTDKMGDVVKGEHKGVGPVYSAQCQFEKLSPAVGRAWV